MADKGRSTDWSAHPHNFIPASEGDSRSPCPALNALANHGVIPRNGRDISFSNLLTAVQQVYSLSYLPAFILTLGGFIFCSPLSLISTFRINLHDLTPHNKLEHDGSLVHADVSEEEVERCAKEGKAATASCKVDEALKKDFLSGGMGLDAKEKEELVWDDLINVRAKRDKESREMPKRLKRIARGEISLIYLTLGRFSKDDSTPASTSSSGEAGSGGEVPSPDLSAKIEIGDARAWLGEDRLPDGWRGNRRGETTTYKDIAAYGQSVASWVWKKKN